MSDIQNWSVTAESGYQADTDPPDGFPEGKLPSVVNNVAREHMAANKRRYADSNGSVVATGSSNAFAITTNETIALHDGMVLGFQANHTITNPATLNRNAAGAKDIRKDYNEPLNAGDIVSGQKVFVVYDAGNDWFQAINIRSTTGNTVIDTFTGDGVQTAFVLSEDPVIKKNLKVFNGGVYQANANYSISGTTLTFSTPPPDLTAIEVIIETPTPAAAVDDDSVGTDQLAGGTAGGLIAFDGAGDPTDIGAGSSGQLLQSNGGSAAPSWGTGIPTGVMLPYISETAPAGWVLASGRTIGSGASSATERANDDTEALFLLLWDSWANNQAPVTGGRGASAAADWAADKVIAVPDPRGGPVVCLDNLGGSSAGRITSASTNGANAVVPGGRIGAETHTLTIPELPQFSVAFGRNDSFGAGSTSGWNRNASDGDAADPIGGNQPHSNTQPGLCMPMIIKL